MTLREFHNNQHCLTFNLNIINLQYINTTNPISRAKLAPSSRAMCWWIQLAHKKAHKMAVNLILRNPTPSAIVAELNFLFYVPLNSLDNTHTHTHTHTHTRHIKQLTTMGGCVA